MTYKESIAEIERDIKRIKEIGEEIKLIMDFTRPYKTKKERIQEFADSFKTGFTPDHYFTGVQNEP